MAFIISLLKFYVSVTNFYQIPRMSIWQKQKVKSNGSQSCKHWFYFRLIWICVHYKVVYVLCKLLAFTKLVVGTKKVCSFFGKTTQFTILLCMYSEKARIRGLHEHNMYVNRFSVLYIKTLIFLSFQNGITLVQFTFALIFCNTIL